MNRKSISPKECKHQKRPSLLPGRSRANGRIKPNYVLVDGKQEAHPEGCVLPGVAKWPSIAFGCR